MHILCIALRYNKPNQRLYTTYGYETHKGHSMHAGFASLYYICRPFTATFIFSKLHTNIHHAQKLVGSYVSVLAQKLMRVYIARKIDTLY